MTDLEKLLVEFESYKRDTQQKMLFFEQQIKKLQKIDSQSKHSIESKTIQKPKNVSIHQIETTAIKQQQVDKNLTIPPKETEEQNSRSTFIAKLVVEKRQQETEKPTSSQLTAQKPLLEKLEEIMPPIVGDGWDYVKSSYDHYKKEGKLQVFFMTIAGIAAILFGSGYLMQYAFAKWFVLFTPLIKILLGFAFTIAIGITGLKLSKKPTFKEYGSALIALSLCLNYLLIYFLVSSYGQSNLYYAIGYVFMITNTFLLFLAAKYTETKIISIITLIGGTLCPVFIHGESTPVYYFVHLLILYALLINLSKRIEWDALKYITVICGILVIEVGIFTDATDLKTITLFLISHAFTYLFLFAIGSVNLKKLDSNIQLKSVLLIISILIAHCLNLYHLSDYDYSSKTLALVYWLNATPFLAFIIIRFKVISKQYRAVLFSIIGSIVALGIAIFFDKEYINIFWAIEATMLMVVGTQYNDKLIRKEAWVVMMIAIAQSLVLVPTIISRWEKSFYWDNWIPLIGILIAAISCHFMLKKFPLYLSVKERFLSKFYLEFSILLSALIFSIPFYWHYRLWVFFPIALILLITILISRSRKVILSQTILSSVLFIGFILILTGLSETLTSHWDELWSSEAFYQFLGIAAILFISHAILIKYLDSRYQNFANIIFQSAFLFLGFDILITGFSVMDVYFFPTSVLVSLAYLFLSVRLKSKMLALFSYLSLGLLIVGYGISVVETGVLHFSAQKLYAKLCAAEIGMVLFLLKSINTKWLKQQVYDKPFDILRTLFYLLIPFAIITTANRHYQEFLAHSMWISLAIAFFLHEITKRKALVIEFYVLLIISTLTTILLQSVLAFVIALFVMFGIQAFKKGFSRKGSQDKNWFALFSYNYYFVGLALFLGIIKYLDFHVLIALSTVSIYYLILIRFRSIIFSLWRHEIILFSLATLLMFLGLLTSWFYDPSFLNRIGLFILFVDIGLYLYLLYSRKVKFIKGRGWSVSLFFAHISIGIYYSRIIHLLDPIHFQTYLTVALVLHGILLLFHTLKGGWTFLRYMYIPLFIIIFLKLFFFDLKDFETIQKVIVLLLSGMLFLFGAWMFIKLKEKMEVKRQ